MLNPEITQDPHTLQTAWFAYWPHIIVVGLMIGVGMAVVGGYAGWNGEGISGHLVGGGLPGLVVAVLDAALFGIDAAGGMWLMCWSRAVPRRKIAVTLATALLILAFKVSDNLVGVSQAICLLTITAVPALLISILWLLHVYRRAHRTT